MAHAGHRESEAPMPSADGAAPSVTLTERAIEMVTAAMQREGVPGYALRVGMGGGGCSGFQYQLGFEEQPKPGDTVLEVGGIRLLIDAATRPYLRGLTIDYVRSLRGAGFKFLNSSAPSGCICGPECSG